MLNNVNIVKIVFSLQGCVNYGSVGKIMVQFEYSMKIKNPMVFVPLPPYCTPNQYPLSKVT